MLRLGAGFLLAAAAAAQSEPGAPRPPQRDDRWFRQGEATIADKLRKLDRQSTDKAKNVILFVADGARQPARPRMPLAPLTDRPTDRRRAQATASPPTRRPGSSPGRTSARRRRAPRWWGRSSTTARSTSCPPRTCPTSPSPRPTTPTHRRRCAKSLSRALRPRKSFGSGPELTDCAAAGLRGHGVGAQHGRQDQGRCHLRARETPAW